MGRRRGGPRGADGCLACCGGPCHSNADGSSTADPGSSSSSGSSDSESVDCGHGRGTRLRGDGRQHAPITCAGGGGGRPVSRGAGGVPATGSAEGAAHRAKAGDCERGGCEPQVPVLGDGGGALADAAPPRLPVCNASGPSLGHRVATANVRTLRLQEADAARTQIAGVQLLGKVTVLEEEFDAACLDAVGIQEGRSRRTEIRAGLHYDRYIGAADGDGGHGCEVWLWRAARFKLQAYDAVSPLILWVACSRAGSGQVVYVSAHAPHGHRPAEERDGFWDHLLKVVGMLASKYPDSERLLLIDANGRVAPAWPHVGQSDADATT